MAENEKAERDIRADERRQLAEILRANVDDLAKAASDKRAAVLLITLLLDMPLAGDAQ